jgi:gamma-D-glutamyl-L-lysine dipeptidyl-peptidase
MAEFTAYCKVSISPLRNGANDGAEMVSQLLFGELITVKELNEPWAKVQTLADGYEGYIDFKHYQRLSDKEARRWNDGLSTLKDRELRLQTPWGVQRICRGSFVPEFVKNFQIGTHTFEWLDNPECTWKSPVDFALDYLNTPYLWGGKSPFGIDCSGIIQVIYRFQGFNLPRDAREQAEHGTEIEYEERKPGDLAYFSKNGKITHVGILDTADSIVHAAGFVRKDKITQHGIIRSTDEVLTHALTSIRRL